MGKNGLQPLINAPLTLFGALIGAGVSIGTTMLSNLEVEIETIKRGVPADEVPDGDDDADDGKEEIGPKKVVKILNRSHKFLKRSSDRIARALKAADKSSVRYQRCTTNAGS